MWREDSPTPKAEYDIARVGLFGFFRRHAQVPVRVELGGLRVDLRVLSHPPDWRSRVSARGGRYGGAEKMRRTRCWG